MSPQNKAQWLGFLLHTVFVYVVGKIGPRLIVEMVADTIVGLAKLFIKKEKK